MTATRRLSINRERRAEAEMSASRRTAILGLLGLALAAIYGVLALWDGYRARPILAISLILLAFVIYLLAIATIRPLSGAGALAVTIAGGLLFRLLLFPEPPFLSDDFFRYLWDGHVQIAGLNPFRHAPADAALAGITDALRARVNHPQVPTIYPPLAQLAFLAAAFLPGGWMALKLLWLFCDLGVAMLLWRLVPSDRRLAAWTLYWWSPLVVIEVAWNAHLDLLGVFPLVLALALARRSPGRAAAIGAALACAALVKYFAAGLLPAAARAARPARVMAAFAGTALALYIPYLGAGRRLFAGFFTYASEWRFNDGLYHVLAWIATPTAARFVAAAIVLVIIVRSARNRWDFERAAFWITGSILVLSPTLHPWYLLWMLPLIAVRPNPAWLYLSGSVFLAYYGLGTYRASGVWPEPWWLKLTIHGPFLVLLLIDGWRGSWWQAAAEALWERRVGRGA